MKLSHNEIYEAALKPRVNFVRRLLLIIWSVVGLGGLIVLAWAEPWSARFADYLTAHGTASWLINFVFLPLVMFARAVVLRTASGEGVLARK